MGDHTRHGKWSQPGVPHRGWSCVHFEDLGEPSQVCEMCESAEVRFVHYLEHPQFAGTLAVGCVCAEHMEDDYLAPRTREKSLRHKARRRKSWAGREWRVSAKGNSYLNTEGCFAELGRVHKSQGSGDVRFRGITDIARPPGIDRK
jgi:hypothetical protein